MKLIWQPRPSEKKKLFLFVCDVNTCNTQIVYYPQEVQYMYTYMHANLLHTVYIIA